MLTYTTKQLATELNTSRNLIDILRQEGCLVGIKKGNGYIFTSKEVDEFLERFTGYDISNRFAIQQSLREIERKEHEKRNRI